MKVIKDTREIKCNCCRVTLEFEAKDVHYDDALTGKTYIICVTCQNRITLTTIPYHWQNIVYGDEFSHNNKTSKASKKFI